MSIHLLYEFYSHFNLNWTYHPHKGIPVNYSSTDNHCCKEPAWRQWDSNQHIAMCASHQVANTTVHLPTTMTPAITKESLNQSAMGPLIPMSSTVDPQLINRIVHIHMYITLNGLVYQCKQMISYLAFTKKCLVLKYWLNAFITYYTNIKQVSL